LRILLIDDSTAYRDEFATLLFDARIKHSVLDHVQSATEGARLIEGNAHDLYVIDYRLPDGDGLALVRGARSAGITKPIIILTGHGSSALDVAASEAGATDYLCKGEFAPETLDRAVRYAIRNAEAVRLAKESASLFKMAQEAAGLGAWEWDITNSAYVWSARMREMFGIDRDTKITYGLWLATVHPQDRDAAQAAVASAVAAHKPFNVTYRILRPDPADPQAPPVLRWIAGKGEVVRDANGTPLRMLGIDIDVTDQQTAIAALRSSHAAATTSLQASETRFQTYFEASSECLFHLRIDPDGVFRYEAVNPAGLAHAGTTQEMIRGRTPMEVLGPQAGEQMTAALQEVLRTGQPYRYEPTFELPPGPVIFDAVYMPLCDTAGKIIGVLGSARDITERRRMEAQLHQAQKMEALGQLAGGVAHDFNNLLTGILGCFELLGRQVKSERGQQLVANGRRAVERSTALTARLLAFSRHQPLARETVDVNKSLEETIEMLTRTLGSDIRIGTDMAPDLWNASTDRNQIELAILNLGINARDAMPLGGSLTIATRNETLTEPRGMICAGDYITVAVSDTGSGMPPDVLARVLEPFFTTKAAGKGTGLGLSMVAGVTRQLGGGLTITSEPDKGTCVTLYLPRAQKESAQDAAAQAPGRPGAIPPVCILLVDDDPDTCAVVGLYAAEAGHQVIEAKTGPQALTLLEAGHKADIMVIDGTLPGTPTAEVIARAMTRRPGLPVLVVSGQTTRPEGGALPVLPKPFRQDAFNNALAELLAIAQTGGNVIPLRHEAAKAR
jgi:PAS domain S-box-containing protein